MRRNLRPGVERERSVQRLFGQRSDDARDLAQLGAPTRIEALRCVRNDPSVMAQSLGQVTREHAEPWADLEHDIVLAELGEPLDHAQDVVVDQEVLPERLARPDAHNEKTRSAFATICSLIASPCSWASRS